MEVSGNCTRCGAPLPLKEYTGGWVLCERCQTPNLIPVVFPKEASSVAAVAEQFPEAVTAPAAPATPPVGKKKWSVPAKIAIGYGVYTLLGLICAPLGAFPFLFVNWEDTSSLAVALVVGIAVAFIPPIVVAVMVVVRMSRK